MTTNGDKVEHTFTVTSPAKLTLRNVSGDIVIEGGKGETIAVTAVKHPGPGFDRTEIDMAQAADGAVRVATRFEDAIFNWLLGGNEPCRVDYRVRVPYDTAIDLAYVSGSATVMLVHGALDLQSVDGPLTVADVSGTLRLRTVSGPVNATGVMLDKPLQVETVSGPVTVTDSFLPGLHAEATSGDLRVESTQGDGPYQINTVSGDVGLYLPAWATGAVQLSSLSGSFHSDLPGLQRGSGAAEAGVNVRISSVSGDVTLGVAPNAPAQPLPPVTMPPPEVARALLDRVARGELTIDEAYKILIR